MIRDPWQLTLPKWITDMEEACQGLLGFEGLIEISLAMSKR
ncbi:peptidase m24, partial [Moniliophthora roreri]